MTFDYQLNWKEHVKYLKDRCLKVINVLKFLSHSTWGADRTSMLLLYRALVRSRLDYGSIIYSSARESTLKSLPPVHNIGLRLATGAFRTSPTFSLYADAGEPPLDTRRAVLMGNYVAKILSMTDHPCFNFISNPRFLNVFNRRKKCTKPLGVRFNNFIVSSGFTVPDVYHAGCMKSPPWSIPVPVCLLNLLKYRKSFNLPPEYLRGFKEILDSYPHYIPVYTDGSKSDTACGCAVVSTYHGKMKIKLNHVCSVFTAELSAIRLALSSITCTNSSFLICSDSASALQSIQEFSPSNPLVQDIQTTLLSLYNKGVHVCFVWIPGHVGITGNERADIAAKQALDEASIPSSLVPAYDIKAAIRKEALSKWGNLWTNLTGNKLRTIKAVTPMWPTSVRKNRAEEVAITRLRIGHCALTHAYLFSEEKTPPRCMTCDSLLSVRHILTECEEYGTARDDFKISGDIDKILGNDMEHINSVIKFLQTTGLIKKL